MGEAALKIEAPQILLAQQSPARIKGLDSLRFICALWVVFGHCGFFPLHFNKAVKSEAILHAFFNNLFPGPAAVIVFFVISGFCIHSPFRESLSPPPLLRYFSRRSLRVGIPIGAALVLYTINNNNLNFMWTGVLWSVLCEEIYYIIYPLLLLKLRRRYGSWRPVLIASYILSLGIFLTNPSAHYYASYGYLLTWIVGLPCWLLGCMLADNVKSIKSIRISKWNLWQWRAGILGAAVLCSALRFHTPVGYPWSLSIFAVAVFFWLKREISYFNFHNHRPLKELEWAGQWSYSLYLLHVPISIRALSLLPKMESHVLWFVQMSVIMLITYVFYLAVEKPSHRLAKKISILT